MDAAGAAVPLVAVAASGVWEGAAVMIALTSGRCFASE